MPKLDADAFLYLNPQPGVDNFAQCLTCSMWVEDDDLCTIHGPNVEVPGTASCGLYIYGDTQPAGTRTYQIVTPAESGLVNRKVRCENCKWGGPEVYECQLYGNLNKTLPEIFDIDEAIDPKGCCNAQQPR